MANSSQFQCGKSYDFTTYAPAFLGSFTNVQVIGVVSAPLAAAYLDIYAAHANVFGSLPQGSAANDASKYDYVIVRMSNGTDVALGLPWIDGSTVQLRERGRLTIDIDDVGPDDVETIRLALSANGFKISAVNFT